MHRNIWINIIYIDQSELRERERERERERTDRADVRKGECSTGDVSWTEFIGETKLYQSIQFSSDFKDAESLNVFDVWNDQTMRCVQGEPNVMRCLKYSADQTF